MELEEKVRELIKWYMDTYGVNKNQAVRDIESVMLHIIIKAKLYKDIINEQDSIINLHKIKYNALHKEVETLQYNLNNSNKTNDNLNKSIERIKRNNRYLVSGGAVCAIAFIVCLLVK